MAVSISDLVQRVRDQLGENPFFTTSTTTTTATTVVFPDTSILAVGMVLEWQTGAYEQIRVRSITNGTDIVAFRGVNGTTAETHSSGDTLILSPTTSARQITQNLTTAVTNLWPYVYKTGTDTLTPSASTVWYDLNASTLGVISAVQLYGSSSQFAGRYGVRGGKPIELDLNLPAALVASTKGLRFPSGMYHDSNTIAVTDMRAVTGTTDIEDSGQFPVADCLVIIAVGRLLEALNLRRVTAGESSDVANTVGSTARLQTGSFYQGRGQQMLEQLAIKYRSFYNPIRMSVA